MAIWILLLGFASSPAIALTIGQVAPPNPPSLCGGLADVVQTSTSDGPDSYGIPVAGVLTSWSTSAGQGYGQKFKLKIFRPVSGSEYEVIAHDGPRLLSPSTLNTFPIDIPVQPGDLIGLNDQNVSAVKNACVFKTGSEADIYRAETGDLPDGSSAALLTMNGQYRANISVTLQPPPGLSTVAPSSGSIAGGTSVIISGHDFTGASAVRFGPIPASSFAVNSATQITAVAPESTALVSVPVTVTTVAGSATAPQTFKYEGCKVPMLKGRKLRASKEKLRKANCEIGQVKGKNAKTAKVKKQSPKAGATLAPGSLVNVKLG